MAWYVYILQSRTDRSYYVGYSGDLELRLLRHNEGLTRSTKAKRPWEIVHTEEYNSKADAIRREKYIKRQKSRTYIERLVSHVPFLPLINPMPQNGILDSAIRRRRSRIGTGGRPDPSSEQS